MAAAKESRRVAAYCRLSREDGDRAESDSIVNQQRLIEDFCRKNRSFQLVATYSDDGYTGTNFERPQFRRMLGDVERGKIDCIVVKDLSRFGRDYIGVGFYLEQLFPKQGVRFIAIHDGVDTARDSCDMLLPIRNVFNAQYAKDVSDKVKTAFKAKQRRGEFCGAFAVYGYRKDPRNSDHLLVDPAAARIVKRVFSLAAEGVTAKAIAERLNAEAIPSPSAYKQMMGLPYSNGGDAQRRKWTYAAIRRMLSNEAYLGSMVANRAARRRMHGAEKANRADAWIVVPGTHEPIVTRELWASAQKQLRSAGRTADRAGHGGLFTGVLRCGDCGKPLVRIAWNKKTAYSCGTYHRYGAAACTNHYIVEDALSELILDDLNRILRASALPPDALDAPAQPQDHREESQLEHALRRVVRLKSNLCADHRDGILSRDEYEAYLRDYDRQADALSRQLASCRARGGATTVPSEWVRQLAASGRVSALDRATVLQLIDAITVYEDRRLELRYRFCGSVHTGETPREKKERGDHVSDPASKRQ